MTRFNKILMVAWVFVAIGMLLHHLYVLGIRSVHAQAPSVKGGFVIKPATGLTDRKKEPKIPKDWKLVSAKAVKLGDQTELWFQDVNTGGVYMVLAETVVFNRQLVGLSVIDIAFELGAQ